METQSRPKKDNILIIAYNDLNNSGVPNVIYQIIKSQCERYHFDIVVFGDDDYYYKKMLSDGVNDVDIIRISIRKPKSKISRFFFYLFLEQKLQYRESIRLLEKKKYKAIHSFKEYDSGPFLKAAKKQGITKRIIHSNVIHSKTYNCVMNKRKRYSLKYATELVGVTDLCCRNAFQEANYKIIHFSYDESIYNKNVQNRLKNNQLVLTQIGTFSSNKNQLFSIEILYNLKKLYPNALLKLIGTEREKNYLSEMNKTIREFGLEPNVEIIDGSKGVGDNLQYTSFTLLTSHKEGASLVVIESQACGIDVFASSSVAEEMNLGGITFLDLSKGPEYWAREIYKKWTLNKNKRHNYDMSSFSKETFNKSISNIYSN